MYIYLNHQKSWNMQVSPQVTLNAKLKVRRGIKLQLGEMKWIRWWGSRHLNSNSQIISAHHWDGLNNCSDQNRMAPSDTLLHQSHCSKIWLEGSLQSDVDQSSKDDAWCAVFGAELEREIQGDLSEVGGSNQPGWWQDTAVGGSTGCSCCPRRSCSWKHCCSEGGKCTNLLRSREASTADSSLGGQWRCPSLGASVCQSSRRVGGWAPFCKHFRRGTGKSYALSDTPLRILHARLITQEPRREAAACRWSFVFSLWTLPSEFLRAALPSETRSRQFGWTWRGCLLEAKDTIR